MELSRKIEKAKSIPLGVKTPEKLIILLLHAWVRVQVILFRPLFTPQEKHWNLDDNEYITFTYLYTHNRTARPK
jgi:hypothetical protein